MITKITTVEELKQIFTEIFLNKTDKVSDISNESVLNALAYGCAKIGQRILTNQAVVEALDGLPQHKIHCSVLAEEAIKSAIKNYYDKHNIKYDQAEFCVLDCPCCHLQENNNK